MNPEVTIPRVGRIEDLPYYTSPPIQFTYEQKADLTLGTYPFLLDSKSVMNNNTQLTDNSLIYIRNVSFYADIPQIDYQQALQLAAGTTNVPQFSMYMEGNAGSPILRNPIQLGNYFREQDYKLLIMPKYNPNNLLGAVSGTLQQTAALAGYSEINITIEFFCQEIVDDAFIEAITRKYPALKDGRGFQL
jgi:hypothetical protein